jgi:hypothetical protein
VKHSVQSPSYLQERRERANHTETKNAGPTNMSNPMRIAYFCFIGRSKASDEASLARYHL